MTDKFKADILAEARKLLLESDKVSREALIDYILETVAAGQDDLDSVFNCLLC